MSYTQDQLTALRANIAKGVLSVRMPNGEQVQFRTLDEMFRLAATMERSLSAAPVTAINPTFDRGV